MGTGVGRERQSLRQGGHGVWGSVPVARPGPRLKERQVSSRLEGSSADWLEGLAGRPQTSGRREGFWHL